ncbi:hypothetical protein DFH11DRAFT_1657728 [Phellopilus nigrolimitatus]|nr:hypothetical protein DFH11DRAFT_1657728 [Phellopilus nigrolimitatus]
MLGKGPRLQPDITTYNTQLRAATLFRRNDMAAKILQMLRERTENAEHSIMYKPHREVEMELSRKNAATPERQKSLQIIRPEEATSSISISTQDQGTADSNVSSLPGDVNHGSTISSESTLRANESTLSIYIAHLTATGDPQVVAKLLFFLIPELRIIDHPAHPLAADTEAGMPRDEACALSRHTAVQRAIGLGPRFFTAVLNALAKAHQTGLAERVWLLARTAERRSWDARFAGAARPWVLPVAAYTIMMQCYAEEARRGLDMQRGAPGPVLGQWTPQTPARVKGWALFVLHANRQRCAELGPAEVSRQMGAVLFRAMHAAGRDLYELVLAQAAQGGTPPASKDLQPPVPDARFFNAALELFARVPGRGGSVRRGAKMTGPPALWRRLNRREFGRFVRRGHSSYPREPHLFGVVQAMAKAGFEVPVAFRRMFIGHDVPEAMRDPAQNRQKPSPYAAGRKERPAAPHRLPVFKTRGLPLRRKKLKIRRGRGSSSSSSV